MIKKDNLTVHQQIKKDLILRINSKEFIEFNKLPSERSLSEFYKVSRVTIRHAIDDLVKEGVLEKKQGSGTYISTKLNTMPIIPLKGALEEFNEIGVEVECKLIKNIYINCNSENKYIWDKLNISQTCQLFFMERLILLTGKPILIEKNYFPLEIGIEFENFNMSRDIIYKGLSLIGYSVSYAHQSICSRLATKEEMKLLNVQYPYAVLVFCRENYTSNDQLALYAEGIYSGEDYKYILALKR
ncbi:MAG: hypothetical protein ATN32_05030 [Candidatus Epulonipiscium fishelsonii]|nr:MAG: hypothetical protein ATN32_05030 [Epulopiscium sp. AS2M-Bin002]